MILKKSFVDIDPDLSPTHKESDAVNDITQAISAKVMAGKRISDQDALHLWLKAPLSLLGSLATVNRNRYNHPNKASFLIDRNINYTNVCNTDCTFCGFYRSSTNHPEAYVLSKENLKVKIQEALEIGATRILLQGGHNDELPYSYYIDLISWIHTNFKIDINAFSPSEILQISKVGQKSVEQTLTELKQVGMQGLPGGGAEILDDLVRSRVSPKKIKTAQWIEVMRIAQSLDLTTTASMVIGFGESIENRLNHFRQIRDLQDLSNQAGKLGFSAFISWPVQFNENTSLGRSRHKDNYGVSSSEFMRNLALSRIYIDNIPHFQASWPTMGPAIASLGLHFGCDDFGSTMMEENVVSQAGALTATKCYMAPSELQDNIEQAGFTAFQRDSNFNIVKVF